MAENNNDDDNSNETTDAPTDAGKKAGATSDACFSMPVWECRAKTILLVLSIPLVVNSVAIWIFNTINYDKQWICQLCRAEEDPAIKQQFMYFTVWNLWFTGIMVFLWAFNGPRSKTIGNALFRVALPHATVVFVTYIYYIATNPGDGFLNEDACYAWGRVALSKTFTDTKWLVDFYLVCSNLSDYWVHWISGPLMVLLLATGEFGPYDHLVPYNVVFIVLLGVGIGLGQTYGARIYCGEIWFQVGGTMVFHLFFHCVYVAWHRRCRCFCCAKKEETNAVNRSRKAKSEEIVFSQSEEVMFESIGDDTGAEGGETPKGDTTAAPGDTPAEP